MMVARFLAVVSKEFLLLWRDRAGMLVLFVMPAVLVVVITLVQENVLKTVGAGHIQILLVDHDQQALGRAIEDRLTETDGIHVVTSIDGRKVDDAAARQLVVGGDYQMAIVIAEGAGTALKNRADASMRRALKLPSKPSQELSPLPKIALLFDPTVLGGFRSAMRNALQLVAVEMEIQEQIRSFSSLLPQKLKSSFQAQLGAYASEQFPFGAARLDLEWPDERLIEIESSVASQFANSATPTSVQQNVPAWALFGMFFIAVPIAGSLIKERQSGIDIRLFSLPVSQLTLLAGKLFAFAAVCAIQFSLILLIGKYLLPLLGTPQLDVGNQPAAIVFMTVSVILAAAGYGILLGTVGKTYEQISMVGPITIVVAGALGGVMVPVYAMPETMQRISIISPLCWGLNGFLDIFVRQGDIATVLPEATALGVFFAVCMAVSGIFYVRRRN